MHAGDPQSFMVYLIPQSSKSLSYDRVCANIHWFSELCDGNAGGRQHAMRLKERTRAECRRIFCAIRYMEELGNNFEFIIGIQKLRFVLHACMWQNFQATRMGGFVRN